MGVFTFYNNLNAPCNVSEQILIRTQQEYRGLCHFYRYFQI